MTTPLQHPVGQPSQDQPSQDQSSEELSSHELDTLEQRIVEQAGDAIIAINTSGDITHWNQKATELFGWAFDEVRGRSVELMIPEKLRSPHWKGFDAAMESGHLASDGLARRTKALTRSGEPTYVEMTFAVLRDDAGAAAGAIAVARPASPRATPTP